jgi:hypothetical protein
MQCVMCVRVVVCVVAVIVATINCVTAQSDNPTFFLQDVTDNLGECVNY